MASTIPPRIANTIAQKPEKTIAIATPPSKERGARSAGRSPGRGCSIATSRNASAGGMPPRGGRPPRRRTARSGRPCPEPRPRDQATLPDANAGPTSPRSARTLDDERRRAGARRASPSAPAASDTRSASPASRRRTCRGRRAERAQDGRLPPPLRDREGERAGDDEERDLRPRCRRARRRSRRARRGPPRSDRRRRRLRRGPGRRRRRRDPGAPAAGRAARPPRSRRRRSRRSR